MIQPKFAHDCDQCRFLFHWADHDVYSCSQGGTGDTIVARFGDDGPDYTSMPLYIFRDWIRRNHSVQVGNESLKFVDYLLSDRITPFHKILLLVGNMDT